VEFGLRCFTLWRIQCAVGLTIIVIIIIIIITHGYISVRNAKGTSLAVYN